MAYISPDSSLPQAPCTDYIYSTTQASILTARDPRRQDDRFHLDAPGPSDFHLNNLHPHGTLCLSDLPNRRFSRLENPHLQNSGVSEPPVTTNFLAPNHPVPGLVVDDGTDPHYFRDIYERASNVTLSNAVNLQEDDGWPKQLEADGYGKFLNPQEMADGRNLQTDATPFSSLDDGAMGNLEGLAPGTASFNSKIFQYTAYPHQPSSSTINLNRPEPPPGFDPLYVSTPHYPSTNTNANPYGLEPSVIPTVPCVPSQQRSSMILANSYNSFSHNLAPDMSNYGCLEPSDMPTPSQSFIAPSFAPDKNISNSLEPLGFSTPVHPVPRGFENFELAQDHLNPGLSNPYKFQPSSTPALRKIAPKATSPDDLKLARVSAPCRLDPVIPDPDPDQEEFALYPAFADDHEDSNGLYPSNNYELSDLHAFNAPTVNNSCVPDALEPHARQGSTDQPDRDAGSEGVPRVGKKLRRQNKSNILPTGQGPHKRRKRTKKTNPNGASRYQSSLKRRKDPKYRFWCAIPTCTGSRQQGHKGRPTIDDMRRHLATHEPEQWLCKLCDELLCRKDGLRQ